MGKLHTTPEMVPLPPEALRDYTLLSKDQLQAFAARGDGLLRIVAATQEALARTPDHKGAPWPKPLRRRGDAGPTVAIFNGARCYQARDHQPVWESDEATLRLIRTLSAQRLRANPALVHNFLDEPLSRDAFDVGATMAATGLLAYARQVGNPVETGKRLAAGGFAVITDPRRGHTSTILPNFTGKLTAAGARPELIQIHTESGKYEPMSSEQLCVTLLQQDSGNESSVVCSLYHYLSGDPPTEPIPIQSA
jgi:hypothetical protein